MSDILLCMLKDHGIHNRIFGLTTDNTLNNKTLVDLLRQALPNNINILQIPCLAHIIQLSLNQLLARLRAVPDNETTETK